MSYDKEQQEWFRDHGGGYFLTYKEGGLWDRAPIVMQNSSTLAVEKALRWMTIVRKDLVNIGLKDLRISFHSIRFPDGREWDVHNGFRKGEIMVDYTKILKDLQVTQEIIRSRLDRIIEKLEQQESTNIMEMGLAVAIKDCIDTGDDFLLTEYIDTLG